MQDNPDNHIVKFGFYDTNEHRKIMKNIENFKNEKNCGSEKFYFPNRFASIKSVNVAYSTRKLLINKIYISEKYT